MLFREKKLDIPLVVVDLHAPQQKEAYRAINPFAQVPALELLGFAAHVVHAQVPVTAGADQQVMLKSSDPKIAANKKLVYDFWREVFEAGHMEKIDQYMAETYIQHNPTVATGRKPFVDFFSMRFKSGAESVEPTVKQSSVTVLGDGNYVTMVFARELPHPTKPGEKYTTTWFDMFRIENGKIAEHWDAAELRAPAAAPKPKLGLVTGVRFHAVNRTQAFGRSRFSLRPNP